MNTHITLTLPCQFPRGFPRASAPFGRKDAPLARSARPHWSYDATQRTRSVRRGSRKSALLNDL